MLLMFGFVSVWAAVEAVADQVLRRYSPYQVVWDALCRAPGTDACRAGRERAELAVAHAAASVPGGTLDADAGHAGVVRRRHAAGRATFHHDGGVLVSPLLIVGLARLFLLDNASLAVWAATVLGLRGALVMHKPGPLPHLYLLVFPLGMALCFSLYVVMTRSLRTDTTRANLFYTALGVFLALSPFMPRLWVMPSALDLLAMVAVGALGFAALYLLDRMAAAAPVSVSAPFAYLQIAVTAGLAVAAGIGYELSAKRTALGLLLIAGATLYVWTRESRLTVRDAIVAQPVQ